MVHGIKDQENLDKNFESFYDPRWMEFSVGTGFPSPGSCRQATTSLFSGPGSFSLPKMEWHQNANSYMRVKSGSSFRYQVHAESVPALKGPNSPRDGNLQPLSPLFQRQSNRVGREPPIDRGSFDASSRVKPAAWNSIDQLVIFTSPLR